METNFKFLEKHDPLLLQLAITAEQAFVPDPNTTLVKMRQLVGCIGHLNANNNMIYELA